MMQKGIRKWLVGGVTMMFAATSVLITPATQAAEMLLSGDAVGGGTGTFYTGCYSPVEIWVDSQGVETQGVDAKFVVDGDFDLQDNNTDFTGFIQGDFDNYYVTNSGSTTETLYAGTGVGTTGTYNGTTYRYINATQAIGNPELSGNIYVATIYLKPDMANADGTLDFYRVNGVNGDESNVSSGTNPDPSGAYTQYEDALTSVANTGVYTFSADYACPFKPYVVSATYTSTLGSPLGDANNFENGDGFEVQAPNDGGNFYGDIVTTAGPNLDETVDYAAVESWEVWTSGSVVIDITANEMTKVDTGNVVSNMDWTNIALTSTDAYATTHQLTVSDNTTTGYVTLYNGIRNYGDTYTTGGNDYLEKFYVDVRWIDTTAPVVGTSSVAALGNEIVTLSGSAAGFANWTTDDDKFRIVLFSGTNTLNYNYPSDPQGYNADLNAQYTSTTGQNFAMSHDITFTETWAGDVYVADIAGNITIVPVSVDVTPQVEFVVKAIPAYRNAKGNFSSTGQFWLFEDPEADGTWVTLHNSYLQPSLFSGLDLGVDGTGLVNIAVPASGSEFMVVYKAEGMLAIGVTGTWTRDVTDTGNNIIDFSSGASLVSLLGAANGSLYPDFTNNGTTYMYQGDVDAAGTRYDFINNFDLTAIELRLTTAAVANLGIYDFDLNGVVNVIEQAAELQSDTTYGFMSNYADQTSNPTQAEFVDFTFL